MKSNYVYAWLNIAMMFGLLLLMDEDDLPTWGMMVIGIVAGLIAGGASGRLLYDTNERR